jgi:hypothetical protein
LPHRLQKRGWLRRSCKIGWRRERRCWRAGDSGDIAWGGGAPKERMGTTDFQILQIVAARQSGAERFD